MIMHSKKREALFNISFYLVLFPHPTQMRVILVCSTNQEQSALACVMTHNKEMHQSCNEAAIVAPCEKN